MKKKISILKDVFGSYYRSNDEYLFKCPFCSHHKRKLSINLKLNCFKCWICDSKGKTLYPLLRQFGDGEARRAWRLLEESVDMSQISIDDLFKKEEEVPLPQHIHLPPEYIFLGNAHLPFEARAALSYLSSREITAEDIKLFKLGFCPSGEYRRRIIFPSFDEEGYCNYFVGRSYTDDWLKYKNPRTAKNIIFNDLLIDWSMPVVLVEGPFDSLKTLNSIPLLGSTLNLSLIHISEPTRPY